VKPESALEFDGAHSSSAAGAGASDACRHLLGGHHRRGRGTTRSRCAVRAFWAGARHRVPRSVQAPVGGHIDRFERLGSVVRWVKEAARKLAFAEDRAIFEGYAAASIRGIRGCSSNQPLALPEDARKTPDVIAQALSELRLAGVDGPYSVLLSADAYTKVSETTEHGYPIREHLNRLVDGEIIWAPAIDGAFVLSTRGGDFDLQLGTDVSIGYLSHDAETVQLYLDETLTFLCYTAEAAVALSA
jgi:uncharacterized linocin/CFP29 family protein